MIVPPKCGILCPDDLTIAEVDALLDPDAAGVPELAPDRTTQAHIARLEQGAAQASGEEQLILQAQLAYALAPVDSDRAKALQSDVLAAARDAGSLRAELEAVVRCSVPCADPPGPVGR